MYVCIGMFIYIYLTYRGFGLVWFHGISTIVAHLMMDLFYTYINYMIFKQILKITFF